MMTSSGERTRFRAGGFFSLSEVTFLRADDIRAINWILASNAAARCLSAIANQDTSALADQTSHEIQIVSVRVCPVIYGVMKKFEELTEREVLALAIALEEEDERVYADFAEGLRQDYPATASMFDGMREEESGHRRRLLELFQTLADKLRGEDRQPRDIAARLRQAGDEPARNRIGNSSEDNGEGCGRLLGGQGGGCA